MADEDRPDIWSSDQAEIHASALADYFEGEGDEQVAKMLHAVAGLASARFRDFSGDEAMYGARVTYIDTDSEPHAAIVIDPGVSTAGPGPLYDPTRDELVEPGSYPMGTVNLVYLKDGEFTEENPYCSRLNDLVMETSVTPLTPDSTTHVYYAGWDLDAAL
jgi:hypothetical protein